MVVLSVIGGFLLTIGIVGYFDILNGPEEIGQAAGLIFTMTIIIAGGAVLLADLVVFLLYLNKKNKAIKE